MKTKTAIEKLIERARDNDWRVVAYDCFVMFAKYSPKGYDFSFDIDITGFENEEDFTAAKLLLAAINEESDNFDPSYEAYLWLDSDGHGKNGAPYDMRDVYDDMVACRDMIDELYDDLNRYYHEEIYVED